MIDEEVRRIISEAYVRTEELLKSKREGLERVAKRLLRQEILGAEDLEELLGKRPWAQRSTFEELTAYHAQQPTPTTPAVDAPATTTTTTTTTPEIAIPPSSPSPSLL